MTRIAKRSMIAVVAIAAAVLASSAFPAYAQYATSCGFILDPPVIPSTGEVHIVGSGFRPGDVVRFFIAPAASPRDQVLLGVTTADLDPDGNVDATFPLPPGFDVDGEYVITVRCPEGEIASNVLVVGRGFVPTTVAPPEQLPATGSDWPLLLLRIAVTLVAIGGIALLFARRGRERVAT
ncbi:MAG: hypothetical protein KatS3mg008_0458 [Acidimicrobiales bacterium]|nr:MAG: hypothetical protein KatS3mg008_0458 [Acidimicrobiales bacterium]